MKTKKLTRQFFKEYGSYYSGLSPGAMTRRLLRRFCFEHLIHFEALGEYENA